MIVSIAQPAYLPWLGYFDRIAKSDLHIVLDHVTYEKRGMTNRNRLRTREGWMWVSVPVQTKGRNAEELAIDRLEIVAGDNWRKKHWQALQHNYGKVAHFAEHRPFFEDMLANDWSRLNDVAGLATGYLLRALGIDTEMVTSRALGPVERKSALILELCRKVEANVYISGPFGREYLDTASFADAGIQVLYHDYQHPQYAQAFEGFEPFMSVVDLLFNHGPASRAILESADSTLKAH